MRIEDAVRCLEKATGVRKVVVPAEEVLNEALQLEDGIVDATFGMPMDNRALDECRKRDVRVCVLCDYSFEPPTTHVITMEDESGKTVAFDIPPGKQGEFENRPGLVWVSDDFVMLEDGDAVKVVMHPQPINCIGAAQGVKNPIVFYPAPTTFEYMAEKLGYSDKDPMVALAVVAFDWVVPSGR